MKKIATFLLAGTMVLGMGTVMPEEIVNDTAIYASAASSKTSIKNAAVSGIKNKYYTGKAIKLSLTVKLGSKTLTKGTDYSVSYKNNKAIGKVTVTIKGKGKYTGTITKTFKICPKKTTLKKVSSPASGKIKVTYTRQTNITAYQITYSTDKNFKTNVVSKSSTKLARTITGLKQGKTYYVKVRTYKTVNDVRYYSGYSEVKKVKIKTAPPAKPVGKGYETYFLADTDFDGDKELVEVYNTTEDLNGERLNAKEFRIYDSKSKHKTLRITQYSPLAANHMVLIRDKNTKSTYTAYIEYRMHSGYSIDKNGKGAADNKNVLLASNNYLYMNDSLKYSFSLNGKSVTRKEYQKYFKNIEILYNAEPGIDLYDIGLNFEERSKEYLKNRGMI